MSKKAIVLGCGLVGGTIARELASELDFEVTVADVSERNLQRVSERAKVRTLKMDLGAAAALQRTAKEFDVVLGALPSRLGFAALRAVIDAGRSYADISFMSEDATAIDAIARKQGVTAIVDCGVSPGMSNVFVGDAASRLDQIERVEIFVGGLPRERRWPFQYKAPFAPSDVIEEYTRPARMIENGRVVVKPALSEPRLLDFPGVGTLEAFNTDGLRSLLTTVKANHMREQTLRYPGHIELMRAFRETGFFDREPIEVGGVSVRPMDVTARLLFPKWSLVPDELEFTVLRVIVEGARGGQMRRFTYDLFDEYDPEEGQTSMARTTGFPCAYLAAMLARGEINQPGVIPPELLATDRKVFENLVSRLQRRGISIRMTEEVIAWD
ncbi:MAG: saccharopine dehydrogenase family protein [Planctomycetes bacterium]|nr:saccharopine dehydrogenase family protein [Planctomycetota bacterium]MBI3833736.1 saccharopine dehydrogenase family protein [Planctomycetota bacterium]